MPQGAETPTPTAAPPGPLEVPRTGFLTVKEAAVFLRLSVSWIHAALRMPPTEPGSIPAYKLPTNGSRTLWRFDADELRAWAHAGCPPVAAWRRMQEMRERN